MAKMKDDLGRQLERALQSVQVAEQKTQEAMSKVESQRLELSGPNRAMQLRCAMRFNTIQLYFALAM